MGTPSILHGVLQYSTSFLTVSEIQTHAQNDQFSRVLAPFERIVRIDRHGILHYQDASSEVRNGTFSWSYHSGVSSSISQSTFTPSTTIARIGLCTVHSHSTTTFCFSAGNRLRLHRCNQQITAIQFHPRPKVLFFPLV